MILGLSFFNPGLKKEGCYFLFLFILYNSMQSASVFFFVFIAINDSASGEDFEFRDTERTAKGTDKGTTKGTGADIAQRKSKTKMPVSQRRIIVVAASNK